MERCVVEEVSYDERDSEGGCVSVMGSLNNVREYSVSLRSCSSFPSSDISWISLVMT
jgi:hypothetical protein